MNSICNPFSLQKQNAHFYDSDKVESRNDDNTTYPVLWMNVNNRILLTETIPESGILLEKATTSSDF